MELVTRIPLGTAVIGANEVIKSIKGGRVKRVIIAKNCPQVLIGRLELAGKVTIEIFDGDQKELGIRFGKPFPIAVAGFEK